MTAPTPRLVTAGLPELIAKQRKEREAEASERLALNLEAMRTALLKSGHPEVAHDFLDADADTAYPLPGVAHPKTDAEVTA
jgi:hypothetical protein